MEVVVGVNSMTKVGGACAIVAGVLLAGSGAAFFISQAGRFDWNSMRSISIYLAAAPAASQWWVLVNWGAALGALLAIGGVMGLADRVRPHGEGLIRWTGTLAIIGYAIMTVTNVADLYRINRVAGMYLQVDESVREALEIIGSGTLDPELSLRFVMIGPWFLAVGWLVLHEDRFPKILGYIGLTAGAGALLFVATTILGVVSVVMVAGMIAVILHPIWLIWTGLILRQDA